MTVPFRSVESFPSKSKMSKRKGAGDVLAEVEDSKKGKVDLPSEKMEVKLYEAERVTRKVPKPVTEGLNYHQVIVTGPAGCGKSWLVLSYLEQRFPPTDVQFLSKQYYHKHRITNHNEMIWDLDARAEFADYRRQSYQEADVALLCFDIKRELVERKKDQLGRLLQPWISELDEHCKNTPIVLVGLKGDLRLNPNEDVFSERDVNIAMKRHPRIRFYREVSALTNTRVIQVFHEAILSIEESKPKLMFARGGFQIHGYNWLI